MSRISPLPESQAPVEVQIAYLQHRTVYDTGIDDLKSTLGHSLPAFHAYMQWYPLFTDVNRFLGDRLASLFAIAVAEEAESHWFAAEFRNRLLAMDANQDWSLVTQDEELILAFGSELAANSGRLEEETFQLVRSRYSERQIVVLTAFAGLVVAMGIFQRGTGVGLEIGHSDIRLLAGDPH